MSRITIKDVEHVAMLSRLILTEEEKQVFQNQLNDILNAVGKLQELNTENVLPTSHIIDQKNVSRIDECELSLSKDKVLQNAPEEQDGFFKVPRILE